MRWLTLEMIKAHLRIDGNEEDGYLMLLGNWFELYRNDEHPICYQR